MEEMISYLLAAIVTVLSGDRVYQGIRNRRSNGTPGPPGNPGITQKDIQGIYQRLDNLNAKLDRHLGYHEGLRER